MMGWHGAAGLKRVHPLAMWRTLILPGLRKQYQPHRAGAPHHHRATTLAPGVASLDAATVASRDTANGALRPLEASGT